MGFSSREHLGGLSFPSPGDLPHLGIEPEPLRCLALGGGFFTTSATWEAHYGLNLRSATRCFVRPGAGRFLFLRPSFPISEVEQTQQPSLGQAGWGEGLQEPSPPEGAL